MTRKRHLTYLTSPWVVMLAPNRANLLAHLYLIKEEFRDTCDFGMYRDDGLGVSKATLRQTNLIKKKLCTIFSKNGLRITIEVNKHTVNFLDMTLDLKNGTHRPFSKPGNIPLYVNSKSNHHLALSKISLSPSTSVFPRYLPIKNLSSKQHPSIKRPFTFPGTITRFPFHRNQHVRHLPERIVPATSFSIIPRSAET